MNGPSLAPYLPGPFQHYQWRKLPTQQPLKKFTYAFDHPTQLIHISLRFSCLYQLNWQLIALQPSFQRQIAPYSPRCHILLVYINSMVIKACDEGQKPNISYIIFDADNLLAHSLSFFHLVILSYDDHYIVIICHYLS